MTRFLPAVLAVPLLVTAADSQTLELRAPGRFSDPVVAEPGDTVRIDVWADLDSLAVSGIGLHLSLPATGLLPLDVGKSGRESLQPFLEGDLFSRGLALANHVSDLPVEASDGRLHVEYAAVLGAEQPRMVTGSGVVASLLLLVQEIAGPVDIAIEDTPVLETRIVLVDGRTEHRFRSLDGIALTPRAPTAVPPASWGRVKYGQT